MFSFQSISKNLIESKEIQEYFNTFWWKVFEREFGTSPKFATEYEDARMKMIEKGEIRRKVLLMRFIALKERLLKQKSSGTNHQEIKVVILGSGGVGKSAITVYFVTNMFVSAYDPTIEDSYRKQMNIDESVFVFDVLDTAGPEEYSAMRDQYMRVADCFILACDINNNSSLHDLQNFAEQVIRVKDLQVNGMPIVFAMNKVDLLEYHPNSNKIIDDFTKYINVDIIEKLSLVNTSIIKTSAKTGENINELFVSCATLKRFGNVQNLKLLQQVMEKDTKCLELSKSNRKKCLFM